MSKILVGGISPESEVLLHSYLDMYLPDVEIEPLKAAGIKGKMKNQASKPDVMMVILDTTLYSACEGFCDDVLSLPKVHKYINDDGLKEYLISKFGKLEIETGTIPPDRLMGLSDSTDVDFGDMKSISDSKEESIDSSSEIANLRDKLAQSELLVRNLTLQLEEANDNNDLSDFVKRIKELECQLEEKEKELSENSGSVMSDEDLKKVVKAEEILGKYDKVVEELKEYKENSANSDFRYNQLKEEAEILRGTVSQLTKERDNLKEDYKQLEVMSEAKDNSIDNLSSKLDDVNAQLEGKTAELELLQQSISSSGKVADVLNDELEYTRRELDDLKSSLLEKEVEVGNLQESIDVKEAEISDLRGTLDSEIEFKKSLTEKLDLSDKEKEELNSKITSLTSQLDELQTSLNEKVNEINSLNDKVNELNDGGAASEKEVEDLTDKLALLEIELNGKEINLKSARDEIVLLKEELSVKNSALDDSLIEKSSLVEKIADVEDKLNEKDSEIEQLKELNSSIQDDLTGVKDELENANSMIAEKVKLLNQTEEKYTSLEQEHLELSSKVEDLEQLLEEGSGDKTIIERLESELLEEKRKSTRLSSELEVMKKSEDTGRVAELRAEISQLKTENVKLQKHGISQEKFDSISNDLFKCKDRISNLEADLAEKIDLITELNSSIFNKMSYVSAPKLACDIDLDISVNLNGNNRFYCFASGSLESNNSVYRAIRKTIAEEKDKRFLIIDLVTDSCIDRELGVQQVNSPINWLNGSSSFKDFIASTKYNNAKCLSTGFSFINDLYLLQVDWEKRLSELVNYGDIIILNIGCLNNTVTKVLYNTFSSLMQTKVIVKATPINLRTLILSMTGLKKSDKTMIYCTGYDEALSKPMYQRLTQKYPAEILSDKDILKL